jgi:hypothetical protein
VALGVTLVDPFSATGVPFNVADTAFLVVQVITAVCPIVILLGLAATPAATAPFDAVVDGLTKVMADDCASALCVEEQRNAQPTATLAVRPTLRRYDVLSFEAIE